MGVSSAKAETHHRIVLVSKSLILRVREVFNEAQPASIFQEARQLHSVYISTIPVAQKQASGIVPIGPYHIEFGVAVEVPQRHSRPSQS